MVMQQELNLGSSREVLIGAVWGKLGQITSTANTSVLITKNFGTTAAATGVLNINASNCFSYTPGASEWDTVGNMLVTVIFGGSNDTVVNVSVRVVSTVYNAFKETDGQIASVGTVDNVTSTNGGTIDTVGNVVNPVTAGTVSDKTGYSILGTKTTLDALNDIPVGSDMNAASVGGVSAAPLSAGQNTTVRFTVATVTAADDFTISLVGVTGAPNLTGLMIKFENDGVAANPGEGRVVLSHVPGTGQVQVGYGGETAGSGTGFTALPGVGDKGIIA